MKKNIKKMVNLFFTALFALAAFGFMISCEIEHQHTFESVWSSDETDHWQLCLCGEIGNKSNHTFGDWTITKEATYETVGEKIHTCSVCGYREEEVIERLVHIHSLGIKHEAIAGNCVDKAILEYYECLGCSEKLNASGEVLSSIESTTDAENHKGITTNWIITARKHKEIYDCCGVEKTEETQHSFGAWTTNDDLPKSRTCSVCDYVETIDYSKCVVGDIILSDGSICPIDELDWGIDDPLAIIVRKSYMDKPALGIGISVYWEQQWCSKEAEGYYTNIYALQNPADGSEAWEKLNEAFSDVTTTKYPAWCYCANFGYDALSEGWYLPTTSELREIYNNRELIDNIFFRLTGSYQLQTRTFWSCCQNSRWERFAFVLDFSNGEVFHIFKDAIYYFCPVRAFY
ncbi:MAG: DUF1566 domain-containing protein [Treponema sp.]|uniref:hypothetical protein n=1 Tax=Treponema sp. TaxID=166 RepID=UPI00298E8176|nr:hypothetical protein [Treponema sp.]MCQ2601876.1 DUF1566 domain-containing protein [Treponema sp.]